MIYPRGSTEEWTLISYQMDSRDMHETGVNFEKCRLTCVAWTVSTGFSLAAYPRGSAPRMAD
eukprot:scaffold149630_cov32-Tisochrysis_lutea.AAC.1